VIRISRRQSIPEHYEAIPLRPAVRALGWSSSSLGIIGGLALAGLAEGGLAEIAGPVVVVLGGVVLAATWQCRLYEVTRGTARIEIGTGPFRDTLATGAMESVAHRPASGWRRCFSDREVVLRFAIGRKREHVVPTRDPEAFGSALRRAAGHPSA
jgi:hypothetical protein